MGRGNWHRHPLATSEFLDGDGEDRVGRSARAAVDNGLASLASLVICPVQIQHARGIGRLKPRSQTLPNTQSDALPDQSTQSDEVLCDDAEVAAISAARRLRVYGAYPNRGCSGRTRIGLLGEWANHVTLASLA